MRLEGMRKEKQFLRPSKEKSFLLCISNFAWKNVKKERKKPMEIARWEQKGEKKNNCSITKTKTPKKALNSSAFRIAYYAIAFVAIEKCSRCKKPAPHETWSEMHEKSVEHVLSPRRGHKHKAESERIDFGVEARSWNSSDDSRKRLTRLLCFPCIPHVSGCTINSSPVASSLVLFREKQRQNGKQKTTENILNKEFDNKTENAFEREESANEALCNL